MLACTNPEIEPLVDELLICAQRGVTSRATTLPILGRLARTLDTRTMQQAVSAISHYLDDATASMRAESYRVWGRLVDGQHFRWAVRLDLHLDGSGYLEERRHREIIKHLGGGLSVSTFRRPNNRAHREMLWHVAKHLLDQSAIA